MTGWMSLLLGLDMLVKFGYCLICDNGPDKKNRGWVEALIKTGTGSTQIVGHCTNCGASPNKNLLLLEVEITRKDL